MILFSLCLALAAFGFMLTHYSLTIDEETWIHNTSGSIGWLSQGRFGIYRKPSLLAKSILYYGN